MGEFRATLRQRREVPITPDEIAAIPITEVESDHWETMALERPFPITVTLTGLQWTVVLAAMRASMAMTTEPGLVRLAHDALYPQVVAKEKTGD